MPSLGADMESGTLLEWLVKPGDVVHRGDAVAVVDTDKAAIEVESFHDGVVGDLLVEPGTRVQVGAPMAHIDGAGAPAVAPAAPEPALSGPAPGQPVVHAAARPDVSPPVRHHAAELGVDLADVVGSGAHGRVTRSDVDKAAATAAARSSAPPPAAPPLPAAVAAPERHRASPYARRLAAKLGVDLGRAGSGEGPVSAADVLAASAARGAVPPKETSTQGAPEAAPRAAPGAAPQAARAGHRPGRAAVAALMSRSKREVPHYYVATTVDLHATTELLRRTNRTRAVSERVVPAAALLRATALTLRDTPALNGFWRDDAFVPGEGVHLGVAVSVRDGGLVAPAIHDAADLSLPDLMAALRDLVTRARSGRLTRAEMADPTFTVTDLGDQGVEEVIGVIYPPQVALLGVGRIVDRPWAVDGLLGVRPVVRLTLSGDHRATDGVTGARFLAAVDRLLQHPEEL
jgi:pyruvate dehydrogenase E2 component (dihydrolipoamide acetyltransferase)